MTTRCAARIAALLVGVAAAPPAAWARERLVAHVGRDLGLPTPAAAITQDAAGYMWFGTHGGLTRWDGVRAVRWAPDRIAGLVDWLVALPDGTVFVADYSRGPLYRVRADDPALAEEAIGPDGVPVRDVGHMIAGHDGTVWVATRHDGFLVRRPDGVWDRVYDGTIDGAHVNRVGVLRDGTVLASNGRGVYRVRDGAPPALFLDVPGVMGIAQGETGPLWIASEGTAARLFEVDVTGPTPIVSLRGTWKLRAWDLAVRGDEAWLMMGGPTMRCSPGGIPEDVSDADRVPPGLRAFVDREGSLWMGTGRGVIQLVEPGTAVWTTRDGLESSSTIKLARNAEGLWISSWGIGASRIEDIVDRDMTGRRARREPEPMHLRGAMCVDGVGDLWTGYATIGARRRGAWQMFPLVRPDDAFGECAVVPGRGVVLGSIYGMWFAAHGGAPAPIPTPYPAMKEPAKIGPLAVDARGTLWVASYFEVCSAPLEGLLAGAADWTCEPTMTDALDTYALAATPGGDVWLGTQGRGILHRAGGRFVELDATRALPSRTTHAIARARDGETIWISGPGYVHRVREGGPDGWTIVEALGGRHGLEPGAGDVLEDPDGTLWLATVQGVVEVPAAARRAPAPVTRVTVIDARIDGRTVEPGAAAWELAGTRNNVELTFSALVYRDPRGLRYRVRTDGGRWSPLAGGATLRLVDVDSGEHRVEVEASTDGETWGGLAAPIVLRVPRPWWARPWLWAIAGVFVVGVVYAILRARWAIRMRLAQQRVNIAMDLHDEIGSGLGSIGILAGMTGNDALPVERRRDMSERVATTAHRLSQSLTDIVSTLRAGGDRLDAMLDHLAERGAALMPGESPKLAVKMPATWPGEPMTLGARRAVQAILLEAMHNAARHATASRVELGADWQGWVWRAWVDDDGVGVDHGPATRPGGGNGLAGMRRRAAAIGAELRVGPGAAGKGTRVEVVFDPRNDEPRDRP
jgi:hypothetical protein